MIDKQIITDDDFVNAEAFCPYFRCETDCYEAVTCQWFVDTLRQLKEKEKQLDKYSQALTQIKEIADLSIAHFDIDYLKQAINEIIQKCEEVNNDK